jgi:ribosomal protein S18 acetylase RimI-like enzyme
MPVLNLSSLLPSLARLSLRTNPTTQTGSTRGAKQSLSGTFDDQKSPNVDSSRKVARKQSHRKCVGFIAVSWLHTDNDTGDVEDTLFIDEFFVDPEARQNKIGRCLLAYAMSQGSLVGLKRAALIVRATHPQQAAARHLYEQAQFAHAEVVPTFQGIPELEPVSGVEEYWEAPIDWKGCDALQEKDPEGRVYVGDTEFFIDSMPIYPNSFLKTHTAIVKKADDHHAINRHDKEKDGDGSKVEEILSVVNLGVYAAYTYERRVE